VRAKFLNGKKFGVKTFNAPLEMPVTNYELRITNFKSAFRFFVILCALSIAAAYVHAQNEASFQKPIGFSGDQSNRFSRVIAVGTVEQKRDALLQIRNIETDETARIAVPALRDKSEIVRATATASVVFLPSDEAARHLLPLLKDKKPLVRREAAYALGKVRSSNAIDSLLQIAQKDKVTEVRNAAIIALGEIGDAAVVSELIKFLQRKPQAKEEFTKRSAARAIGQIAQIIRTGQVTVVTPENFLPDRYETIGDPNAPKLTELFLVYQSAIGILIQTLNNPREFPDVKREAAFALGAIGDAAAISVLQTNLNNADYYLAEICRESLKKIQLETSPR
jgi:HEAT repeat protein